MGLLFLALKSYALLWPVDGACLVWCSLPLGAGAGKRRSPINGKSHSLAVSPNLTSRRLPVSLHLHLSALPLLSSTTTTTLLSPPEPALHLPGRLFESTMHKISNFTGQARHGWEKMTPSMGFGMSRSHNELPVTAPLKRPSTSSAPSPAIPPGTLVNLSFNVPFASNLAGPESDDILYASPGAFQRWTHPEGTPEGTPNYKLLVHVQHVDSLRQLCRDMSDSSGGAIQASVVSSEPKPIAGLQRGPLRALITNVCLSGEIGIVQKMRGRILNETPISLVRFPIEPTTRKIDKS